MTLNIPEKPTKKQKTYYLDASLIDFVSQESGRVEEETGNAVSENAILGAIIRYYIDHSKGKKRGKTL